MVGRRGREEGRERVGRENTPIPVTMLSKAAVLLILAYRDCTMGYALSHTVCH